MDPDFLSTFISRHRLPANFGEAVGGCYAGIFDWLTAEHRRAGVGIIGINGAQGTGKSTLADFLVEAGARARFDVVSLSLDDFYLPLVSRRKLAQEIHPLLATRGVPGTHDTVMLADSLRRLAALPAGASLRLPVFDKASDDRSPAWREVTGPIDVVLLEGWCVGANPQSVAELTEPVNALEREEDPDGLWRSWVNDRLATDYAAIFDTLDRLVFLEAPDMACVFAWRRQQEKALAEAAGNASGVMDETELRRFVQHYERITRHCLRVLPGVADVTVVLDAGHGCERVVYRDGRYGNSDA